MFASFDLTADQTLYDHDADEHHDWRQVEASVTQTNWWKCPTKGSEDWFSDEVQEAVDGGDDALGVDREPAQNDSDEDQQYVGVQQAANDRHC